MNRFESLENELMAAFKEVPKHLSNRVRISAIFDQMHRQMNSKVSYEETLDSLFTAFDSIVPFDRIGIAVLDEENKKICLRWVKSKMPINNLEKDYCIKVTPSILEIIHSESPRIINDLEKYSQDHPDSDPTKNAIEDGIKSNLTFPLYLYGSPEGVIFFSSCKPHTYDENHIELYGELSAAISSIIEQGFARKTIEEISHKEKYFRDTLHDLNNPLQIILGTLNLLKRKDWFKNLSEDSRISFNVLQKNCDAMIKLTSKLTYGTESPVFYSQLTLSNITLADLLKEVTLEGQMMGEKKGIKVSLKAVEPLPEMILADLFKLKEAIGNLLSNAIKYSHSGKQITIEAKSDIKGEAVSFTVKDEGQGIPKEELDKLFTEYGKTCVQPTQGEPSRGLGLANVKRVIDLHGGKVFVKSVVGQGSEFGFWIPSERII